jgi:ABC-type multidrug transport system fused ATPase/permease subunit
MPRLSLFVLAAFRLLPAISRQFNYINAILYSRASVNAVYKSIFEEKDESAEATSCPCSPPENSKDITVRNVTFAYPRIAEPVLEDVSLVIPEKKSVAFIGPSGAGKTTLADIILGILPPSVGGVF